MMKIYNTFDDMHLKTQLMKAIRENGYVPSSIAKLAIVPLSEGRNVILQATCDDQGNKAMEEDKLNDCNLHATLEQGKIAAYSIGILNQLNFSSEKCRCLIILHNECDSEIVGVMQSLSKYLVVDDTGEEKKVIVEDIIELDLSSNLDVHVVVGGLHDMLRLLGNERFCADGLERVIFDLGNRCRDYNCVLEMINKIRNLAGDQVKFAVFCENKLPEVFFTSLKLKLEEPEIILIENPDMRRSLQGIINHQFVAAQREARTEATIAIIKKHKLGVEGSRTIILVDGIFLDLLADKLKEDGFTCAVVGMCYNEKIRDAEMKKFMECHLLLTSRFCHHNMGTNYFSLDVHSIINYEFCDREGYMDTLGWYQKVTNVINLIDVDWHFTMIRRFEGQFNIRLQRVVLFGHQMKPIKMFREVEHYLWPVGRNWWMRSRVIICLWIALKALGGTSVFFVKSDGLVSSLVQNISEVFGSGSTDAFGITTSISEAVEYGKIRHPCVFVTYDDCVIKKEELDEIKKNVKLIMSCDLPDDEVEEEHYRHRFEWCDKDSVIILHMATQENWARFYDLRVSLKIFSEYILETNPNNLRYSDSEINALEKEIKSNINRLESMEIDKNKHLTEGTSVVSSYKKKQLLHKKKKNTLLGKRRTFF